MASSNHVNVIQNKVLDGPDLRIVANAGHLYFRLLVDRSITLAADLKGKENCDGRAGSYSGSVGARHPKKARARSGKGCDSGPYPNGSNESGEGC